MTENSATPEIAPSATAAAPAQDPATLAALRRRTLLLLSFILPAVVLTVILVIAEHRKIRAADFADQAIPATISVPGRVWTSNKLTFSEQEMEILETRDYVYRTYTDGSASPVELCVVFSEDNRKGTHPPDVCLEASGYRILSRQDRMLDIPGSGAIAIRELVTTNNTDARAAGQYLYFAYFYKCGDTFTTSFYQQQIEIIWNGLARRNASGALVRYSTTMSNFTDVAEARARTDQLIALTFPYIRDNLR